MYVKSISDLKQYEPFVEAQKTGRDTKRQMDIVEVAFWQSPISESSHTEHTWNGIKLVKIFTFTDGSVVRYELGEGSPTIESHVDWQLPVYWRKDFNLEAEIERAFSKLLILKKGARNAARVYTSRHAYELDWSLVSDHRLAEIKFWGRRLWWLRKLKGE